MSIDRLAEALLLESKKESEQIVSKAKKEANSFISAAHEEEKELLEKAEITVKDKLESQKKERLAWANLERKRILSDAREHAVTSYLDSMQSNLYKLRTTSSYPNFMKKSFESAVDQLSGAIIFHVVKGDKKYLPTTKSSSITISEDLKASGGLLAESAFGKIIINYTLETIFETKRTVLRKEIFNALFGG
ncbi:MAG: V-type ATP synthase subunit E [Candidatus ainarchaeum sp.]|nr:V-type ATP synthase subunit E [Candidatus ainarchaeum sp.]